jgi:hypothetical protein
MTISRHQRRQSRRLDDLSMHDNRGGAHRSRKMLLIHTASAGPDGLIGNRDRIALKTEYANFLRLRRLNSIRYGQASTRHHANAKKAPGSLPHSSHASAK